MTRTYSGNSQAITDIDYEIDTIKMVLSPLSDSELLSHYSRKIMKSENDELITLAGVLEQGMGLSDTERQKLEAFAILCDSELGFYE